LAASQFPTPEQVEIEIDPITITPHPTWMNPEAQLILQFISNRRFEWQARQNTFSSAHKPVRPAIRAALAARVAAGRDTGIHAAT